MWTWTSPLPTARYRPSRNGISSSIATPWLAAMTTGRPFALASAAPAAPTRSRPAATALEIELAGARQAHAPVHTFEQRRPEQALEVGNGAAHGRLGCVEFPGGGAETAEPGGAFEDAQVAHRRQWKRIGHSGPAIDSGLK